MVLLPTPFGVFNVDKPAGKSSRKVVDVVKQLVRPAKCGHAGTLDPLATGVLVVCVGPATRLIPFVQDQPKTYRGTFRLGCRSETDDVEGEVVDVPVETLPTEADVRAALPAFVGRIEQVPPAFSAVHVDGRRAYKLARKGKEIDLEPRPVDVYRLELLRFEYPEVDLEIECGSGTYIRSIGRDLGETLGCGAVMTALQRTAIGPFRVEDAVASRALDLNALNSPLACIASLPQHACTPAEAATLSYGKPIEAPADSDFGHDPIALVEMESSGNPKLLAIAEHDREDDLLKPRHVFVRP